MNGVVQGYTEVLVYLASAHSHHSRSILKDTLVLLTKVFNHTIHDFIIAMAKLAAIDMEANSHLFAFNSRVGHARIAWVDDAINVHYTLDELPVIQKACDHCSLQGVMALHHHLFYSLLVLCDIWIVHIWGYLHHNLHQDSSDIDEGHILLVLDTRLYNCVWDIHYCDVPFFLGIDDTQ
jgi:hypothetical protein